MSPSDASGARAVAVDPAAARAFPGVSVVVAWVAMSGDGLAEAADRLWTQEHGRWHEVSRGDIRRHPRVEAYRGLARMIGTDPDKQPPSIQALVDRGLRGKPVGAWPRINPVVDLVNAVAVSSLTALGVFDADRVSGDVRLAVSAGGEPFQALGTSHPEPLDAGRLLLVDDERVLSLFAHRDGVHQAVRADSTTVLVLGCVVPGVEVSSVEDAVGEVCRQLAGLP